MTGNGKEVGPIQPPFECGVCRNFIVEHGSVGALDGKPVCHRCTIPLRPLMFALDAERAKVAELRKVLQGFVNAWVVADGRNDADHLLDEASEVAEAVLAKTGGGA